MDYTELFDRYIDGLLEGKELEDFRKRLESDPELKKNLQEYILIHNAAVSAFSEGEDDRNEPGTETDRQSRKDIANYGKERRGVPDKEMMEFMKVVETSKQAHEGRKRIGIRKNLPLQMAIAASVMVALVMAAFFYLRTNKLTSTELYARYYKPYVKSESVFEITRSNDDFYYAVKVFESGDYARAAVLFTRFADSSDLKVYSTFYGGLTYLEMGRWEEAMIMLEATVLHGESQVLDVARWYLGLCFLRMDNAVSARSQFEKLASYNNQFTSRSRRILRLMH